jgi:hypothetical protein
MAAGAPSRDKQVRTPTPYVFIIYAQRCRSTQHLCGRFVLASIRKGSFASVFTLQCAWSHAGLQRCGKSCRLRWINYLRPDLKRGSFSQQEEALIVELHRVLGNR